jgi:transglutaminase-like putative cysteine protease
MKGYLKTEQSSQRGGGRMQRIRYWQFRKWSLVIPLLAALALLAALGGFQKEAVKYRSTEEGLPKEKHGMITFSINLKMPEAAKELRLWLPYVTSNEHQTIENVKIDGNFSYSGIYKEAQHGNVALYAEWREAKKYAKMAYSFKVKRREIMRKNFPKKEALIPTEVEKFLLPTTLGPITGGVKGLATDITNGKETVLAKAMAIYDYIVENAERDPTVEGCGIGDVRALLKNLKGKCVDLSSVFVALARSVAVPAREILGIRIANQGDITGAYHCRAEFYLPGYGWVPVDPSDVRKLMLKEGLELDDPKMKEARDYYFGAQTETYIDFYTGRDITLSPEQKGGKLNFFMYPYAEVDGQSLDYLAVYKEGLVVTFKEL